MNVWAWVGIVFLFAFLTETLSEYFFGALCNHIKALVPYKWAIMYIAAAVGVAGAFIYQFDILSILAQYLGAALPVTPFGVAITGLAIGRGSNYLHDLVARFFTKPVLPE